MRGVSVGLELFNYCGITRELRRVRKKKRGDIILIILYNFSGVFRKCRRVFIVFCCILLYLLTTAEGCGSEGLQQEIRDIIQSIHYNFSER